MYKTKENIVVSPDRIILKGTQQNDNGYFVAEDGGWFRFTEPFMDSHPEIFEKVEEKSLAEELLEKYDSLDKDYILRKHALQAMQEYHKLYKQKCGNQ